jgi:uncharacterized protein (DUF427 family)
MALHLGNALLDHVTQLRYEPTTKRVRALIGDHTVVDTIRARLVWEPLRVVPTYAVPIAELACDVAPAAATATRPGDPPLVTLGAGGPRVIEAAAFALHTADGDPMTLRIAGRDYPGVAFFAADPDLAGYVILDFDAFAWLEEDEPIHGHPRDPFHRVDLRRSSRHVRIGLGGVLLAETTRPLLVFETRLPQRCYVPRADVRVELSRSAKTSYCAYKGPASYYSAAHADRAATNVVWAYETPLPDAAELAGYVAFFDERVDVTVDGVRRERPQSPWS